MDFSQALVQLKKGHALYRKGWNGTRMSISIFSGSNQEMDIPYIYMRSEDGKKIPWTASQTDLLANDWDLRDIALPMVESLMNDLMSREELEHDWNQITPSLLEIWWKSSDSLIRKWIKPSVYMEGDRMLPRIIALPREQFAQWLDGMKAIILNNDNLVEINRLHNSWLLLSDMKSDDIVQIIVSMVLNKEFSSSTTEKIEYTVQDLEVLLIRDATLRNLVNAKPVIDPDVNQDSALEEGRSNIENNTS